MPAGRIMHSSLPRNTSSQTEWGTVAENVPCQGQSDLCCHGSRCSQDACGRLWIPWASVGSRAMPIGPGGGTIRAQHCRAGASAPSAAAAPSSSYHCCGGWPATAWHRPALPLAAAAAAVAPAAILQASLADAYHNKQQAQNWSQAVGGVLVCPLGPRQHASAGSQQGAYQSKREATVGRLGPGQHASAGTLGPPVETGGTGSACWACSPSRR